MSAVDDWADLPVPDTYMGMLAFSKLRKSSAVTSGGREIGLPSSVPSPFSLGSSNIAVKMPSSLGKAYTGTLKCVFPA